MKKLNFIILVLIQLGALLFTACGRMGPVPAPDKTPPKVIATVPTDSTPDWSLSGYIILTFSKEMDPTTLNAQTVVLADQNGNLHDLSVTYATNGTDYIAVVKPSQNLEQDMPYSVTVSGTVTDKYGIAMGTSFRTFFRTQKLLFVQSTAPAKDAVNIATNTSIAVLFSKTVDPLTIKFNLYSTSTGTVPYTMDTTNNPNVSFTLTPTPQAPHGLISQTTYTATVSSGLVDTAGDVMKDDYVWSFTTGADTDTIPPYVQTTDPANGAIDVPVNPLITITFSELVRTSATTTLTLYSTGTGTITCDGTYNNTQYIYTLPTSIAHLAYGTQFRATLSAGVQDLAGNQMATPYLWNFTTLMAATQTTITAPAIAFGVDGSVTVSVAASGTGMTPTGNVSLSVDSGTAMFKPLTSSGSATFTISSPSAGNHSLLASYPTHNVFLSSFATGTLSVGLSTTSMTVSSIPNPSAYGSPVTFTARVTPSAATGTVTFMDGATTLGTGTLSGGTATFGTSALALGSHSITAAYAGNANFGPSTSSALTQTVNQAATTTLISAPAVTYNANGTVTVTVTSGALAVTGNVSLSVDSGAATTLPLSNGSASFTITSPSVGSHTLSASYATQGNFGASSNTGNLTVNPAPTSTSISAPAVAYGANGIVTVTVSSGILIPTGNVSLSVDGGTPMLGSVTGTGIATFTITSPSLGNHTLNASYAAQGNFGASSAYGILSVGSAVTATTITPPATVTYGANGSVTVTVSSGTGTPTGSVSLTVDGGAPITQGLISGSAIFTIPSPIAGSHALSASYAPQGSFGASSGTGTLTVNKAVLTVAANNVSRGYNTANPVFTASYSGFVNGDTVAVLSGAPSLTTTAITASPVGTYPITAAAGSLAASNYTFNFVNGTLTITQTAATVTLGNLSQTYDGTPKSATATTTPSGLAVSITYNGSATAPTLVGSYAVVATITDPNYQGTASGTLNIAKAAATVTLGSLSQAYDGTPKAATATTTPSGLTVAFTYNGSATAPTAVGSYTVVGTISDANYQGSATGTLVISSASATVTLGSLSQTYDGTPKAATATTTPSGLTVAFTYNGSATAPTNAGSYTVVGTITSPGYTGSASGTLNIAKAAATVTLGSLSQAYDGTPQAATATTTPSGLTVTFTYNGSATAPTAIGSYTVVGTISDTNYQGTASGTLTIGKGTATVTLGSLSQAYDGTPKAATAQQLLPA